MVNIYLQKLMKYEIYLQGGNYNNVIDNNLYLHKSLNNQYFVVPLKLFKNAKKIINKRLGFNITKAGIEYSNQ